MIGSILAERQRKLQDLTWSSGQIVTRDLPRDTVLKKLNIRVNGVTTTTFGSAPTAYEWSSMDGLLKRIDIVVNGSRVVKSVRPHLLHMEQLLATNIQAERKSSAGAAAAYGNNPTADAGFTFGATTNITTVAEMVTVSFEMCLAGIGKQSTYLSLKGAASAELRLQCGTTADLDKTTNCTFSASVFTFEVTTIEAQDIPPEVRFSDWKQTYKEVTFSAQVTENTIDINRGNFLAGIKLFAFQDANAVDGTAANRRKPNNMSITDIKLLLNGTRLIKVTNFLSLQAENRVRFGVQAPYASNQSRLDGFAYLDLLDDRDIRTALDTRPPNVDNVQLVISTRASDATNNIYPIGLGIETGEIVNYGT